MVFNEWMSSSNCVTIKHLAIKFINDATNIKRKNSFLFLQIYKNFCLIDSIIFILFLYKGSLFQKTGFIL